MARRRSPPLARLLVAGALVASVLVGPPASAQQDDDAWRDRLSHGVVGLQVTYQQWDRDRPWVKRSPGFRAPSAVVVDDRHLLTTAVAVRDATFLVLETFGRARRIEPRIVLVDPDVNLALLAIDDDATRDGLRPVEVARRTPASGVLRTVRWRGQQVESAASRVIRFDVERSATGLIEHAFVELRTDMSRGGWGEPVFDDETLVGITVSQAQQRSRAIPAEIITRFLEQALGDAPYRGFASLGVKWQVNRDAAVSRFLGQQGDPRGVLVRQIPWGTSACGTIEPRDILLELDGHSIDADGFYRHPWLGRLKFPHIFAEGTSPGDEVTVRVLREGRELELALEARAHPVALDKLPNDAEGPPPFMIVGGLLIRELTLPYLGTWGSDWTKNAPPALVTRYFYEREAQTPERRRFVIIAGVLPHAFNLGYQDMRDLVLERVNGRTVGALEDVADALRRPDGAWHVFELAPESPIGRVVLDAAGLDAATAAIVEEYGVPLVSRERERPLPAGGGECAGDY